MAILKSKILDLERIEREGSAKVREERASYDALHSLDDPQFPFGSDDYE